jgi:uncharacterized protein
MIPEFPKFKNLEFGDKADIENFTKQFLPYSDFNFYSLWSWNIDNQFAIARIHDNLAVRFTDYVSSEHFISFIGASNINKTVEDILQACEQLHVLPMLKLVPEEEIKSLTDQNFQIVSDRDNFDYIYSVDKIRNFSGSKLSSKRNYAKRFRSKYSSVLKIIDLSDKQIQAEVKDLFLLWAVQKDEPLSFSEHEFQAVCRFLDQGNFSEIIPFGLYIENKLIAFWFLEKVKANYVISHFQKANVIDYIGINPYLMQESANILFKMGIEFINYEQDLGIKGLREGKSDYDPICYLKKFIINKRST